MKYSPNVYETIPKEDFILYYICDETNGKYTIKKFMADGSIKYENYDSEASFESAKDRYNFIMEEQVRIINEKFNKDKLAQLAIYIGPGTIFALGAVGTMGVKKMSWPVFVASVSLALATIGIHAFRQSLTLIDDMKKNDYFLSNKRRINKALLFDLENDMLFNGENDFFSKDADRIIRERRQKNEPLSINDIEFFRLDDLKNIIKVQKNYQENYDLFVYTIRLLDPLFQEPEFSTYFDDYDHKRIFMGLSETAFHKIMVNFARETVLTADDMKAFTEDDIIKLHVMSLSIKEEYERVKEARGYAKTMNKPKQKKIQ